MQHGCNWVLFHNHTTWADTEQIKFWMSWLLLLAADSTFLYGMTSTT